MDPSQVQEVEALRMCECLGRPGTPDNLRTLQHLLAQHGGTAQHALDDPLSNWPSWRDFLEDIDEPVRCLDFLTREYPGDSLCGDGTSK